MAHRTKLIRIHCSIKQTCDEEPVRKRVRNQFRHSQEVWRTTQISSHFTHHH